MTAATKGSNAGSDQIRQSKINDEDLDQQRRAAHDVHVNFSGPPK
ncbi:hypothetical protein EVA_08359 [gut metagenome]|uniref:Uncharacterized protein n=1 Tax=gut metagenome TaxID=749906 RepID=J9GMR9_9ZZZZ